MRTLLVTDERLSDVINESIRVYSCLDCARYSDGSGCNGGGADAVPSCLDGRFNRNDIRREVDQYGSADIETGGKWLACNASYTGSQDGVRGEDITAEETEELDSRFEDQLEWEYDHDERREDEFDMTLRDIEWEAWDEWFATLPSMRYSRIVKKCTRCKGTGQYGHLGECRACNGTGRIIQEAYLRADWKRPSERLVRRDDVIRDLISRREVAVLKKNEYTKKIWLLKTCVGFVPREEEESMACFELDRSSGYQMSFS